MTHKAKILETDYKFSDALGNEKWLMLLKHNQLKATSRKKYGIFILANLKETVSDQPSFSNREDLVVGCDLLQQLRINTGQHC